MVVDQHLYLILSLLQIAKQIKGFYRVLSTVYGCGVDITVWAIRPFNGVFDDHCWEKRLLSHVLHCCSHYCYIGFLSFPTVEANHDDVSLMKLSHI